VGKEELLSAGGEMSTAVREKRDVARREEMMALPRKPQPPVMRMGVWVMVWAVGRLAVWMLV
jgi:hypothetical protein